VSNVMRVFFCLVFFNAQNSCNVHVCYLEQFLESTGYFNRNMS